MKNVFSMEGLHDLRRGLGPRTLLAFDFDGTLAPIVSQPENAKLAPSTEDLVRKLASFAPTVVVTGRSLKDIRSRVPLRLRGFAGNHGAEGLPGRDEQTASARKWVRSWQRQLEQELAGHRDIQIENKRYSLTLHFRSSRQRALRKKAILEATKALQPEPRVVLGKCVVNVIPPGLPNKGDALLSLRRSLGMEHAVYVGDDDTDEDVFSLPDSRICSIRVGAKPNSHASLFIERQRDINRLLRVMLHLVCKNDLETRK